MFIPILSDVIKKNLLPYTLDFSTKGFDAAWTAPNWAVSGGTAKNTPTVSPTELVLNGGFGSDTGSWIPSGSSILLSVAGGQAGNCLQVQNGAVETGSGYQNATVAAGTWYLFSTYHKNGNAGGLVALGTTATGTNIWASPFFTDVNWSQKSTTFLAGNVNCYVRLRMGTTGNGSTTLYDTATLKAISNLIAYRNFPGAANVIVKAPWTIAANYQAGVVARVSADGSQYLIAYHNGTTCYLLKVLTAGTTQLIGITTAYVAGANIEIRCTGNTIQLFYNNAQVGTDQTETTLSANTRHGLFSTDVSCTVPSINVVRN